MSFDPMKWKMRASLLYAMGAWTIFGSLAYQRFFQKNEPFDHVPKEEEETRKNVKEMKIGIISVTTVYKENFVPYSTRFLNLFRRKDDSSKEHEWDEE